MSTVVAEVADRHYVAGRDGPLDCREVRTDPSHPQRRGCYSQGQYTYIC